MCYFVYAHFAGLQDAKYLSLQQTNFTQKMIYNLGHANQEET